MKVLGILLCCLGAAIVLFLLVSAIAAALVGSEEPCSENRFYRRLFQTWINLAIPVMRIKLDISGLELLPKDTPILYVGNHRSNFDPILAWYVLKDRPLGFVSKEGNFHIPIMGRLIRRCSCLSIDRSDPRKAIGSIYQAADILKSGISMGVYPEGTRSKDGTLLPFHTGVFKIAKRAGAPIAVIALDGSEKIHKNYPFHRSYVRFRVAAVLDAETVAHTNDREIGAKVEKILRSALPEMK